MKKILVLTLAIALVLGNGFFMFEGVMASAATVTGEATGSSASISIPYNVDLTVDPEMSLTCDTSTDVILSGDIDGMTGGTATGNRACTAITNNEGGYTMQAKVAQLKSVEDASDVFGNVITSGGATWTSPGAGASEFGFKEHSAGSWAIADGSTAATLKTTSEESSISGDAVTVDYEAEITGPALQVSGLYQAVSTISLYMN